MKYSWRKTYVNRSCYVNNKPLSILIDMLFHVKLCFKPHHTASVDRDY